MSDLRNKVQSISPDLKTQDIKTFAAKTGNIYHAINIIAARANQLSVDLKIELNQKLEEFAITPDRIEEVIENKEQIEISKFYERLPHPSVIATEEYLTDKLEVIDRSQPEDTAKPS